MDSTPGALPMESNWMAFGVSGKNGEFSSAILIGRMADWLEHHWLQRGDSGHW